MLGHQTDLGGSRLELRCLRDPGCEGSSGDRFLSAQESVVDVVHQGGHHNFFHRLECDGVDSASRDRAGVAARMFSAVADSSHMPLLRGGWDNDLDEACVHVIDQA